MTNLKERHQQKVILLDRIATELKDLTAVMEQIKLLMAAAIYRDEADMDAQSRIRVIGDDVSYGGTK